MPCSRQELESIELGDTITLVFRAARFSGINPTDSLFGLSTRLLAGRYQ